MKALAIFAGKHPELDQIELNPLLLYEQGPVRGGRADFFEGLGESGEGGQGFEGPLPPSPNPIHQREVELVQKDLAFPSWSLGEQDKTPFPNPI